MFNLGILEGLEPLIFAAYTNGLMGFSGRYAPIPFQSYNTETVTWKQISSGYTLSIGILSDDTLWSCGMYTNGQLGTGNMSSGISYFEQIGTSTWKKIACPKGMSTSVLAIRGDNTLWAWGGNSSGQLGLGYISTCVTTPTQVGTSTWKNISISDGNSAGILYDDTVWVWGSNICYQLGNGTTSASYSPIQMGTSTWKQFESNSSNYIGILYDNTAWFIGSNNDALAGNGTTTSSSSLIQIGSSTWKYISAYRHVLAISNDDTLWSWGNNSCGQLGIGSTTCQCSPVQLGTSTWKTVAVGNLHSLGITYDDCARSWGNACCYQLGNLSLLNCTTPQLINYCTWKTISAGYDHSEGIQTTDKRWFWGNTANVGVSSINSYYLSLYGGENAFYGISSKNELYTWGSGFFGQLGTGNTCNCYFPTKIGTSTWKCISGGYCFALGIQSDDTLWAWGANSSGQLGISGTTICSPTKVGTSTWKKVFAQICNTFALNWGSCLYAWGCNLEGNLGLGHTTSSSSPTQVGTSTWKTISAGMGFTLGLLASGILYGWGFKRVSVFSPFDEGTDTCSTTPIQLGTTIWKDIKVVPNKSIVNTMPTVVGIRDDNTLWSWGSFVSSIGLTPTTLPISTAGTTIKYTMNASHSICAYHGFDTTCGAISTNNVLYMWGDYCCGNIPPMEGVSFKTPTVIPGSWTQIGVGSSILTGFAIGLKTDNTLWSWGSPNSGRLGNGTTIGSVCPISQIGTSTWKRISVGYNHTLAILNDDTLWVWGNNTCGQLGEGTFSCRLSPFKVGVSTWKIISTGYCYSIAIRGDNTLWAWGCNAAGQLGIGSTLTKCLPTQVGTSTWKSVSAGHCHTLAILSNDTLWAWGSNLCGKLGIGSTTPKCLPTQVGTSTWKSVSAGDGHTLAILSNDTLWAWGNNACGQLGVTGVSCCSSPIAVQTSTWKKVFTGFESSLGLTNNPSDGELYLWGCINCGYIPSYTIRQISGGWEKIEVGDTHVVAMSTTKGGYEWGQLCLPYSCCYFAYTPMGRISNGATCDIAATRHNSAFLL